MADLAEARCCCGRITLFVAGIALAMEGDNCREGGLPDHLYNEIPDHEMATATIGGEPIRDMLTQLVRFFRGDVWNGEMLRFVADKINATANPPPV